jgi:hypothetical protein
VTNTSNPPNSRSAARPGSVKAISKEDAQRKVLELIQKGSKAEDAAKAVGRTYSTYESWRKKDPSFADALRRIRGQQDRQPGEACEVPDFETFCREDLKQPLFDHQLRILDMLEGRTPRSLHPSMTFEPGDPSRAMANMPTGHAKTVSFSINYSVWRIARDPNVKIVIVSKSQGLAKDIVGAIKQRLASPLYADMQDKYAPDGGWKDPDASWTMTEIWVAGRSDGEKDPTVQALGMGGQIYGARADLIILDDAVTLSNVGAYESQLNWLNQEVDSRLPPTGGQMLILGTRVSSVDLYSEIRKISDEDDQQAYAYLAQPAVLDFGEGVGSPETWTVLWPETIDTFGERQPMWTGPRLAKKKARYSTRAWSLTQMQANIPDGAPFPPEVVDCSVNRRRFHGNMLDGAPGHRVGGMDGLYVCAGYDPAASGFSAFVVLGADRLTHRCWILDLVNKRDMSASEVQATIRRLTDQYSIKEWVIETNAMNRYVSQDPEITGPLRAKGVRLRPHHTGTNKTDPDYGVLSLGPMFLAGADKSEAGPWRRNSEKALIDIPNPRNLKAAGELITQLITWVPKPPAAQKTDLVMALWFAVIAAREAMGIGKGQLPTHLSNGFLSARDGKTRRVINLAELRERRLADAG